jgi:hypothetical protein
VRSGFSLDCEIVVLRLDGESLIVEREFIIKQGNKIRRANAATEKANRQHVAERKAKSFKPLNQQSSEAQSCKSTPLASIDESTPLMSTQPLRATTPISAPSSPRPRPRPLEFKDITNTRNLKLDLDILEEAGYLNNDEAKNAFSIFSNIVNAREGARMDAKVEARSQLKKLCKTNKQSDLKSIINFIATCNNNEILPDLHRYLLTAEFNYLREKTGTFSFSAWHGTDEKGNIVRCSKSWAMIEKAISLQMLKNTQEKVPDGRSIAFGLASSCKFFSIRRWGLFNNAGTSKTYDALVNDDLKVLNQQYTSHFASFKLSK